MYTVTFYEGENAIYTMQMAERPVFVSDWLVLDYFSNGGVEFTLSTVNIPARTSGCVSTV